MIRWLPLALVVGGCTVGHTTINGQSYKCSYQYNGHQFAWNAVNNENNTMDIKCQVDSLTDTPFKAVDVNSQSGVYYCNFCSDSNLLDNFSGGACANYYVFGTNTMQFSTTKPNLRYTNTTGGVSTATDVPEFSSSCEFY